MRRHGSVWEFGRRLGGLVLCLALSSAPLGAEITIHGFVQDVTGMAIEGAEVQLLPIPGPFEARRLLLAGLSEPAPAATARANGYFMLSVPHLGMWKVVADAEGFVPMVHYLDPLLGPKSLEPVRLRRDVGTPIRVRLADGSPAAGGWIWASSSRDTRHIWRESHLGLWLPAPRTGRLDAEGSLSLPRAEGEGLDLHLFAPGFEEEEAWRDVAALDATVRRLASEERTLEIRGPTGEPAPGVLVSLREDVLFTKSGLETLGEDELEALEQRMLESLQRNLPPTVLRTVGASGEDGRLLIAAPVDRPLGLELFTDENYGEEHTLDAGNEEPVVLRMKAPQRLRIRILDAATRQPLPEALVWTAGARWCLRADERGEVALPVPPGKRTHGIRAGAPGYRSAFGRSADDAGGPVLALEPVAALVGRVVDSERRPLANVRIRATDSKLWSTRSGSDGRFRLSRSSTRRAFRLVFAKEGLAARRIEVAPVQRESVQDLGEVTLDAGTTLTGRVMDSDRNPVPGAALVVLLAGPRTPGPRDREPVGQTRGDGRFEIPHQPSEPFDLEIRREGFAELEIPGIEPAAKVWDLGTVILERAVTVEGRVVDAADRPVAGARVWTVTGADRGFDPVWVTRRDPDLITDGDGRFHFEEQRAGDRFHLVVRQDGHVMACLENVDVPPEAPLRVALETAARVSGRVVSADGKPVPRARIRFRLRQERRLNAVGSAFTGADGRFRIDELPPGAHRLAVEATGHPPLVIERFTLVGDRELEGLRLQLPPGSELRGRVVDADGQGIAGANVLYRPKIPIELGSSPYSRYVVTDAEGSFRFPGLPIGDVEIKIDTRRRFPELTTQLALRPGGNERDFVVVGSQELRQVRGTVRDENGAAIPGAEVTVTFVQGRRRVTPRASSGADGSFRIHGLPRQGTYELLVTKEGLAPSRRKLDARSDASVEVTLSRGSSLSGHVLGLASSELGGLRIGARQVDERGLPAHSYSQPPQARIGRWGTYELRGLAAGRWRLHARTATRQLLRIVSVEAGEDATLDLDFASGLRLTGRVRIGGRVAGALRLALSPSDFGWNLSSQTDYRGEYRFEGLEPGTYRLKVWASDSNRLLHERELELVEDRELVIELGDASPAPAPHPE